MTRYNLSIALKKGACMRDNGSRNMYGLTQLTSDVAAQMNGVTERQVRDVLSTAFETIMRKVEGGDRVSISNFGSWWPAMRGARKGTDIRSGQQIEIGGRRAVNPAVWLEEVAAAGKDDRRARGTTGAAALARPRRCFCGWQRRSD